MSYDSFGIMQCMRRFIAARRWACFLSFFGGPINVRRQHAKCVYEGVCCSHTNCLDVKFSTDNIILNVFAIVLIVL